MAAARDGAPPWMEEARRIGGAAATGRRWQHKWATMGRATLPAAMRARGWGGSLEATAGCCGRLAAARVPMTCVVAAAMAAATATAAAASAATVAEAAETAAVVVAAAVATVAAAAGQQSYASTEGTWVQRVGQAQGVGVLGQRRGRCRT